MKKKTLFALLLGGCLAGQNAWADRCDYNAGFGPMNLTVPLSIANISVGTDVAVGTIVHSMRFTASGANRPTLVCRTEGASTGFTIDQYLNLTNTPAPVAGWSGIYPGAVYQTSIPGLGFAIVNNDGTTSGKAITTAVEKKWATPIAPGSFAFYYGNVFTVQFIKTGPMSAGVLNGAQLGTVLMTTNSVTPVTNVPDTPYRINFSGNMNVIAASCTTPDVNVDLGKWNVSNWSGTNSGKTTPWVAFNILLKNCPAFHGNYLGTGFNSGTGFSAGNRTQNSVKVDFLPGNGVIDAARGIIRLADSPDAAKGAGIQVARSDYSVLNLLAGLTMTLSSSSPTDFTIPLAARYIQTETAVHPGKADGKMTFTINYY